MRFSNRTDWDLTKNPLSQRLEQYKAEGISWLDLTESNPGRAGISYPKDLLKFLEKKSNLLYEPSPFGLRSARQAIQNYYKSQNIRISEEQILVTASTSEAYSFIFRVLTNPGDSVLIPEPSYPLFSFLAGLHDVEVKPYRLQRNDTGWHIDFDFLKSQINPLTKMIITVNPNNPTGSYVKQSELDALNQLGRDHNLALISDEVFFDYSHAKDENRAPSFTHNKEVLTFTLSGISKVLGLPQMKLGWIITSGPQALVHHSFQRLEVIADTFLSVNTPAQNALPEWLGYRSEIQNQILARVKKNKEFLLNSELNHTCQILPIEGGWYATCLLPFQLADNFALSLLSESKIFVHPTYFFDFNNENGFVLSLLTPIDTFRHGIIQIINAIKKLL